MTVEQQIQGLRVVGWLAWLDREFSWHDLTAKDGYTASRARQTLNGALDILRGYGAAQEAAAIVAKRAQETA